MTLLKKLLTPLIVLAAATWVSAQTDNRKEVMPEKVQFNSAEAKEMLALGKSTINGTAVAREYTDNNIRKNYLNAIIGMDVTGTKHLAPEGTVVMLFPYTEYFKEYLKLRDRYAQSRKYVAVLSKDAFSHRLEAKVGRGGKFSFPQMKPGKYYIETNFTYVGTGLDYVQVGRTDYYNGYGNHMRSEPIYQGYNYNYLDSKVESKIVTVKEDGTTVDIKL